LKLTKYSLKLTSLDPRSKEKKRIDITKNKRTIMYANYNLMQLAAIPLPFIFLIFHLVEAIQQSGCANFFQLAPLPLCDGTSQIPGISSGGISSGGISSGGISSGGISSGGSSSGGFGSGGFGSGGFGSGGFSSGGFGSGAPTAKAPTATVGKLPARRLRFRRNHQSNSTDINNVSPAEIPSSSSQANFIHAGIHSLSSEMAEIHLVS
jgi:hypothetical protein